jgi:hypothetical protein
MNYYVVCIQWTCKPGYGPYGGIWPPDGCPALCTGFNYRQVSITDGLFVEYNPCLPYDPTEYLCTDRHLVPIYCGTIRSCTICAAGTYQSQKCNYGNTTWTHDVDRTCDSCEMGKYSGQQNATACTPCAIGTYTNTSGSTVCTACTACTGTQYESTACTNTTNRNCSACADTCTAGTYESTACTQTSNRVCTACTDGYYMQNGSYTICPSGYTCLANALEPVECQCGTYCPIGSVYATNSDIGYYAPKQSGSQIPCIDGKLCYISTCEPIDCNVGHYCKRDNMNECPYGSICTDGVRYDCANNIIRAFYTTYQIVQISNSYYCPGHHIQVPLPCPIFSNGFHDTNGIPDCDCTSRLSTYNNGLPIPMNGVVSSYEVYNNDNTFTCIICPANTHSPSRTDGGLTSWGKRTCTACDACPSGTHSEAGQAFDANDCLTDSTLCPANTYQAYPNSKIRSQQYCEPCPGNSRSPAGSTSCDLCDTGWENLPFCDSKVETVETPGFVNETISTAYVNGVNRKDSELWTVQDSTTSKALLLYNDGTLAFMDLTVSDNPVWVDLNKNAVVGLAAAVGRWIVETLAISADDKYVYTIIRDHSSTPATQKTTRKLRRFTMQKALGSEDLNNLNTNAAWTSLTPTSGYQVPICINSFYNANHIGFSEFRSLVLNPSSTLKFYFTNVYCTGYIIIENMNYQFQILAGPWAEATAGDPAIKPGYVGNNDTSGISGPGRITCEYKTRVLKLFAWKPDVFVALVGAGVMDTWAVEQAYVDTSSNWIYPESTTSVYTLNFSTMHLTHVVGMDVSATYQCSDYALCLFRPTMPIYYSTNGSSNSLLYSVSSFVSDAANTNYGYVRHAGYVAHINLLTKQIEPVFSEYNFDTAVQEFKTETSSFIQIYNILNAVFLMKQETIGITIIVNSRSQHTYIKVRRFCSSGQYAGQTCATVLSCAVLSPTEMISCGQGMKRGKCVNSHWTCIGCPRETSNMGSGVNLFLEKYTSPGYNCMTTCKFNLLSGSDQQNGWSIQPIASIPTRCLSCDFMQNQYTTVNLFNNSDPSSISGCGVANEVCPKDFYYEYAENQGALYCVACPLNTHSYGSNMNIDQCTVPCAIGTYTNTSGSTVCTACTIGTYTNTSGSTVCTACAPPCTVGQYESTACTQTSNRVCTECPAHTYSFTANSSSSCLPCPHGSFRYIGLHINCTTCPFGSFFTDSFSSFEEYRN